MKSILSIILILAAALLFFFFTKPKLAQLQVSQLEVSQLDVAENAAKRLKARINDLVKTYNGISPADRTKIETMIPNSVENVKLIIDFDKTLQAMVEERGTAALYARNSAASGGKVAIENPKVSQAGATTDGNFDASKLGVVTFTFSVTLTYGDFLEFLRRIEHSTRILDVDSVSFSATPVANQNTNDPIYTFDVGLKTYWLKYTTEVKTKTN